MTARGMNQQAGNMNDRTDNSAQRNDSFFLDDQERWESLGFDWQGWNSTVEKILQRQAPQCPGTPGVRGHCASPGE